jgi:hypothetical protein
MLNPDGQMRRLLCFVKKDPDGLTGTKMVSDFCVETYGIYLKFKKIGRHEKN